MVILFRHARVAARTTWLLRSIGFGSSSPTPARSSTLCPTSHPLGEDTKYRRIMAVRSAHPVAHHHQGGETVMKRALFAAIVALFSASAGAQGLTLHGA